MVHLCYSDGYSDGCSDGAVMVQCWDSDGTVMTLYLILCEQLAEEYNGGLLMHHRRTVLRESRGPGIHAPSLSYHHRTITVPSPFEHVMQSVPLDRILIEKPRQSDGAVMFGYRETKHTQRHRWTS